MTRLAWDQVGERFYEAGVSNGVLYKDDRVGVPWNGLTSVDEKLPIDASPVYFDGHKINEIVTVGDFQASLSAYTFPDEFLEYQGTLQDQEGFFITGQPPKRFGLSYQTKIGSDVDGLSAGYKIHILYNLLATPNAIKRNSIDDNLDPMEFDWDISSIPEDIENFRPTAHVILDSRKTDPYLLLDVEDILYGTDTTDPYLPSLKGLSAFIRKWNRLVITDNEDGTWTASSIVPDVITMLDATSFQIVTDSAVYLDADTYEITSSDKNEEDVWLP